MNIVYGLNLKNANDETKNIAAIDLYDGSKRIAVQVTSDKSANKIKNTLDKFFKNDLDKKYDRLLFVVIVNSKSYRADFSQNIKNNFKFDKEKDIITIDTLLKEVTKLQPEILNKLLDVLDFYINTISDTFHICSPEYLFDEISRNTNGYLNESYFEIDDRRFKERFVNEFKKNDIIRINAFSKEEGLFCILNLIRNTFPDTRIVIIMDYESWMRCREYLCDTVVIPFFSAEEIPAIPDSKTIFIKSEHSDLNNELTMPKRTIRFLTDKLRRNECPDSDLVKESKGDYYYIKKSCLKEKTKIPNGFMTRINLYLLLHLLECGLKQIMIRMQLRNCMGARMTALKSI